MTWRPVVVDLILGAALLVLGTSVGLFAVRHFSGRPLYYQNEFGPAVMVAAGRGFVNPISMPGTPLTAFLTLQRPAVTDADTAGVGLGTVDQFQRRTSVVEYSRASVKKALASVKKFAEVEGLDAHGQSAAIRV